MFNLYKKILPIVNYRKPFPPYSHTHTHRHTNPVCVSDQNNVLNSSGFMRCAGRTAPVSTFRFICLHNAFVSGTWNGQYNKIQFCHYGWMYRIVASLRPSCLLFSWIFNSIVCAPFRRLCKHCCYLLLNITNHVKYYTCIRNYRKS